MLARFARPLARAGAAACRAAPQYTAPRRSIALLPGELTEFSVVYTDRVLNHMSPTFISVMNDLSSFLKEVYHAHSVAIVPGSGSYGMESVARQFATGKKVLVIRNGFFSFRWTQILEEGGITDDVTVMKARPVDSASEPAFAPPPIDEVVTAIRKEKPAVVCAPHVETSAGIILPNDYIKAIADAVHEVGGIFILDGIASGAVWVNMKELDVDVYLSAPQKGWTGPPCAGLVMMNERGRKAVDETKSTSFVLSLKSWVNVMETYEKGGHIYHCTMPTDSLRVFRDVMAETRKFGFDKAQAGQWELGKKMRELCAKHGYKSVAAEGFGAPGVVVCYGESSLPVQFKNLGIQIAAGVPLKVDEPQPFNTFRFGFFGLDKIQNVDKYVAYLDDAFQKIKNA